MSKVRGAIAVRRLLQRAPDAIRAELGKAMQQAGPELKGTMVSRAPRGKTGRLVAGIDWKFYPKTLRLVVGFIGKRVNRKLFYANIIEQGRKGQLVTVTRRVRADRAGPKRLRTAPSPNAGTYVGSPYKLRVRKRAPHHFVYGDQAGLRNTLNRNLNGIWQRALGSISGVDHD